jgi:hypothetical protein
MKGMLRWAGVLVVFFAVGTARADVTPIVIENLTPIHDTYATHDDGLVHGFETFLRVGIEPQQCIPGGWDPCDDDDLECCIAGSSYNYCAPPGQCATTDPEWSSFRKYRSYLRFDLNSLPKGKVLSATLRLTEVGKVQEMGGPFKLTITALKKIGLEEPTCEWYEQTLNDTNGTTWNSLPQNLSVSEEGMWFFDVTKALTDWLNGNEDQPGNPIMPNCGFHLYDDAFGKKDAPIQRWVDFGSKESQHAPQLKVEIALDLDGDGYFGDCNEEDPDINPGAVETCDDIDNDCDGKIDEENCDGLDNDCDGLVDEGEELCDPGLMCIYHECKVVCQDECTGATKLKCVHNADTGLWERWGCKKNADEDPCWDWYKAEDCGQGEYCQYGYCSGNCVDVCDVDGALECVSDTPQIWFAAVCKDSDNDGCLDLNETTACGKGEVCTQGACAVACQDECTLGEVQCQGNEKIEACFDGDGDGCVEWTEVATCDPGVAPCEDGECGGQPLPCEDECLAGATKCTEEDDTATLFHCVTDADADVCLEWGNAEECETSHCNAMGNDCANIVVVTDSVEPAPDVISPPEEVVEEVVAPDVPAVAEVVPGEDIPPAGNDVPASDDQVAADTAADVPGEEPKKKKDGGCTGTGTANPAAALLLLALALGIARLRRSWQ